MGKPSWFPRASAAAVIDLKPKVNFVLAPQNAAASIWESVVGVGLVLIFNDLLAVNCDFFCLNSPSAYSQINLFSTSVSPTPLGCGVKYKSIT